MKSAVIFDLNGTMIDDMSYHVDAWHKMLHKLGADMTYDEVKSHCYGKNEELLERIFPNRYSMEEKQKLSLEKEIMYQDHYRPHIKLLEGLPEYLHTLKERNIPIAIGSAASKFNIDFTLDALQLRECIDVIVCGDDVEQSKPHPETFLQCAKLMKMAPENCLVFEDSIHGVQSALSANMQCIGIVSVLHQQKDFEIFKNIPFSINNYKDPRLQAMFQTEM